MSKAYELADGSLSTDYEIGDEFVLTSEPYKNCIALGDKVKIKCADDDSPFCCKSCDCGDYVAWDYLTPTPETKRKAQARKRKFPINLGDYIDSREFTREECERFCELAAECGFGRGEWMAHYSVGALFYLHIRSEKLFWCTGGLSGSNITAQFREFLDKDKGMSKFTKDDLKDGMRVELRDKDVYYIVGERLAIIDSLAVDFELSDFNADLTNINDSIRDIFKVTDRDGTVLFERKPEKRKVTFELTEEQEQELRKQLGQ